MISDHSPVYLSREHIHTKHMSKDLHISVHKRLFFNSQKVEKNIHQDENG